MHPLKEAIRTETRRQFFGRAATGLGGVALANLLSTDALGLSHMDGVVGGLPSLPHVAPRATRCIYLHMLGGPPQMDLLDYKPRMKDWYGKELPESLRQGPRLTTMTSGRSRFRVAPSVFNFAQHGQSGTWFSELLPHTATMADDLAVIRSMHTDATNHESGIALMQTGQQRPGRPCIGSALAHGLGSLNKNVPPVVVLHAERSHLRAGVPAISAKVWRAGLLPPDYAGVGLRAGADPEIEDLSSEPDSTFRRWGEEARQPGKFQNVALRARRLVERGVRCVQIYHRGWDVHAFAPQVLPAQARDVDRAAWALIQDLKERGLFDETLVIWGGEFGRTIYSQGRLTPTEYGRDHHPRCFSLWMAGGGVKGGIVHGETDDFSHNIVKDPVHIRDFHATILHLFGIDHERFTHNRGGLDARSPAVEPARVVHEVLA